MVTQREVGEDVHTFADGLKYALRQDPDVIYVGEIRDRETAQMALALPRRVISSSPPCIRGTQRVRSLATPISFHKRINARSAASFPSAFVP